MRIHILIFHIVYKHVHTQKQVRNPRTVEKRIANSGGRTDRTDRTGRIEGINGIDGIDGIDGTDGTDGTDGKITTAILCCAWLPPVLLAILFHGLLCG